MPPRFISPMAAARATSVFILCLTLTLIAWKRGKLRRKKLIEGSFVSVFVFVFVFVFDFPTALATVR